MSKNTFVIFVINLAEHTSPTTCSNTQGGLLNHRRWFGIELRAALYGFYTCLQLDDEDWRRTSSSGKTAVGVDPIEEYRFSLRSILDLEFKPSSGTMLIELP